MCLTILKKVWLSPLFVVELVYSRGSTSSHFYCTLHNFMVTIQSFGFSVRYAPATSFGGSGTLTLLCCLPDSADCSGNSSDWNSSLVPHDLINPLYSPIAGPATNYYIFFRVLQKIADFFRNQIIIEFFESLKSFKTRLVVVKRSFTFFAL